MAVNCVFCQVGVPEGGGDVLLDFVVCMVVGQCTGWFQTTSPITPEILRKLVEGLR